jgi:hypothetical protein
MISNMDKNNTKKLNKHNINKSKEFKGTKLTNEKENEISKNRPSTIISPNKKKNFSNEIVVKKQQTYSLEKSSLPENLDNLSSKQQIDLIASLLGSNKSLMRDEKSSVEPAIEKENKVFTEPVKKNFSTKKVAASEKRAHFSKKTNI